MPLPLATIVPPQAGESGLTRTQGTKVVLADGTTLHGVTRIEIIAAVNDVWRARVDCLIKPVLMPGMLTEVQQSPGKPLTFWRRLLLRAAGVSAVDLTTLDSRAKEYSLLSLTRKPSNAREPDPTVGPDAVVSATDETSDQ